MTRIPTEIDDLAREIDRLAAKKPHAATLLQAFGPLILDRYRWLGKQPPATCTFPLDPLRYQQGIPLRQQCQLLLPEDSWLEAGLSTAEAIAQGFPQFTEDMGRIAQRIRDQEIDGFTLCEAADDNGQLAPTAKQLEIDPVALQLFHHSLTRLMLALRARDLRQGVSSWSWRRGYCPVCGSFPHLAILREQGQRWLQCPTCSHEWSFARLSCPYCDHEDPQETHNLFIEGNKEDTAFICQKCQKYLLTSNQAGNLRQIPADLIALSLVHLDLILQEKGFLPMAECEWNTFATPQEAKAR